MNILTAQTYQHKAGDLSFQIKQFVREEVARQLRMQGVAARSSSAEPVRVKTNTKHKVASTLEELKELLQQSPNDQALHTACSSDQKLSKLQKLAGYKAARKAVDKGSAFAILEDLKKKLAADQAKAASVARLRQKLAALSKFDTVPTSQGGDYLEMLAEMTASKNSTLSSWSDKVDNTLAKLKALATDIKAGGGEEASKKIAVTSKAKKANPYKGMGGLSSLLKRIIKRKKN
ncbi:MAG: hypothetical protein PVJ09_05260 [Candidatus Woesebacteria bacterium]|jgi:hypothetical protein